MESRRKYPAILTYHSNDQMEVRFPDFDISAKGQTPDEVWHSATGLMHLALYRIKQFGLHVPEPSIPADLVLSKRQDLMQFEIDCC